VTLSAGSGNCNFLPMKINTVTARHIFAMKRSNIVVRLSKNVPEKQAKSWNLVSS
jgi:hypothetical protein